MIKAIVFDCYGVLVGRSFSDVYEAAGGDARKDSAFIEEMLGKANAGLISPDEFATVVAQKLGITNETWMTINAQIQLPNEQLFEYIRNELKPKYKIAMLSNANKGSVERRIPADKLALFDAVVVSGEVGCMKPDRRIYEITAQRLGVAFSELIFIDDIEEYVAAAETCGIASIRYTDFEAMRTALETRLLANSEQTKNR